MPTTRHSLCTNRRQQIFATLLVRLDREVNIASYQENSIFLNSFSYPLKH